MNERELAEPQGALHETSASTTHTWKLSLKGLIQRYVPREYWDDKASWWINSSGVDDEVHITRSHTTTTTYPPEGGVVVKDGHQPDPEDEIMNRREVRQLIAETTGPRAESEALP